MNKLNLAHLLFTTFFIFISAIKFEDDQFVSEEVIADIEENENQDLKTGRIINGGVNARMKKKYSNHINSNRGEKVTVKPSANHYENGQINVKNGGTIYDQDNADVRDNLQLSNPILNENNDVKLSFEKNSGQPLENTDTNNYPSNPSNVLEQCLRDENQSVLPCLSIKTINFLERYSHTDDINVEDNLILSPNENDDYQSSRLIPNGEDPHDLRTGLEAISSFLSRRTIRYHLQALYPGLFIVVNPTYNGKGIIEFQLDSRNPIDERQLSTGRLLIKRNVLPLLLGFKISIISIIPIVFAIIFFLTKKAMILSKLALLVTSFIGFSSVSKLLAHGIKGSHHHHHHAGGFHQGGHLYHQGHSIGEPHGGYLGDSFLGNLFGSSSSTSFLDDNYGGYKKYSSGQSSGVGAGEYNPEPELVIHTPGFKKENNDRSGRRVQWNRT